MALVGHAKSHVYPDGRWVWVQLDGSWQPLSHQNCRYGPTAGWPMPGTEAWEPPTFGEEPEERHTTLEVRQLRVQGSKDRTEPQKGDSGQ